MEIKKIKSLLDAIKETDIEEIWIEKNGKKSGFSRKDISAESSPVQPKNTVSTKKESSSDSSPGRYYIKSQMVGTFFRTLSPGGKPLAEEGDFVTIGQKVCVIEAMKVMKEVTSSVEGKIIKILVQDNHPVEYGQPIFEVEPQNRHGTNKHGTDTE